MESSAKVHVHPVVLLSIIDSYERRNEDSTRVIGNFDKGIIEVTNSYAVPYKESDHDINRNERIVGWYASGNEITEHAKLIHQDYYMQHYKDAIFLLVDAELSFGNKMALKAFRSRPVGVPGATRGIIFLPLDVDVECNGPEQTAVHMMAGGSAARSKDKSEVWRVNIVSYSSINRLTFNCDLWFTIFSYNFLQMGDDLIYLCQLSSRIQEMLDHVLLYVEQVVTESKPMESSIGRAIAQLIFSIPKLDPELIDNLINSSFRDLLMITYLTNLIKTHLKLLNLAN
ncbi:unnamed protein product [Protopolystoma xenopodis]|uniref:JAB1/MPN/MOV34 metalloenzyme domain-containing protein n=1 Tax=Protopolystoma xenopodis TaxID=117903 RepID=A0A3S5AJR0_9PLAT|nr:unnamed protein product [Protopolystoma xenopodis]